MQNDKTLDNRLEQIGEDFTLNVLKSETQRHPENIEALAELANLLTKSGQYEEGLAVDLKLVSMRPSEPIVHYNLACSYARLLQPQLAILALQKAIELGYTDKQFLLNDEDLKNLHSLPEFQKLLEKLRA